MISASPWPAAPAPSAPPAGADRGAPQSTFRASDPHDRKYCTRASSPGRGSSIGYDRDPPCHSAGTSGPRSCLWQSGAMWKQSPEATSTSNKNQKSHVARNNGLRPQPTPLHPIQSPLIARGTDKPMTSFSALPHFGVATNQTNRKSEDPWANRARPNRRVGKELGASHLSRECGGGGRMPRMPKRERLLSPCAHKLRTVTGSAGGSPAHTQRTIRMAGVRNSTKLRAEHSPQSPLQNARAPQTNVGTCNRWEVATMPATVPIARAV